MNEIKKYNCYDSNMNFVKTKEMDYSELVHEVIHNELYCEEVIQK